jgi:hypothetical protein
VSELGARPWAPRFCQAAASTSSTSCGNRIQVVDYPDIQFRQGAPRTASATTSAALSSNGCRRSILRRWLRPKEDPYHAPQPGRVCRNQLPGRVEAFRVPPDAQDRGLRRPSR